MKASPLRVVDGHDAASGNRFGEFARRIIAGGEVREEDCTVVRPRSVYVVRSIGPVHWIEELDLERGKRSYVVGVFFGLGYKAHRVAAALMSARTAGVMDVLE